MSSARLVMSPGGSAASPRAMAADAKAHSLLTEGSLVAGDLAGAPLEIKDHILKGARGREFSSWFSHDRVDTSHSEVFLSFDPQTDDSCSFREINSFLLANQLVTVVDLNGLEIHWCHTVALAGNREKWCTFVCSSSLTSAE